MQSPFMIDRNLTNASSTSTDSNLRLPSKNYFLDDYATRVRRVALLIRLKRIIDNAPAKIHRGRRMKSRKELNYTSFVRGSRRALQEALQEAQSKLAQAEYEVKLAQAGLDDARDTLEFHQKELAAFNQRHPEE